jgi:hypothetical protein
MKSYIITLAAPLSFVVRHLSSTFKPEQQQVAAPASRQLAD